MIELALSKNAYHCRKTTENRKKRKRKKEKEKKKRNEKDKEKEKEEERERQAFAWPLAAFCGGLDLESDRRQTKLEPVWPRNASQAQFSSANLNLRLSYSHVLLMYLSVYLSVYLAC